MEFCDAGSVAGIMAKTGYPLEEDQIAVVCWHTVQGLIYLHSNRMIHR
jgi:serine/threonine protein kinase